MSDAAAMAHVTLGTAALFLGLGLGLYVTPLVRQAALRFGVLDRPDGRLKTHAEAVPYLGGVAVYLAFLLAIGTVFDFNAQLLGLLLGGTVITMVGLFDDLRVLPPGLKLGGQCLAVWVMLKSHIMIQLVFMPTWAAMALTVLWLVGITNAVNIIDVSDGLATGVSLVALVPLAILAWANGNDGIALPTLALCGALGGFLWFNRPPARIYLGDTGSMFVGFMLAALSMTGAYTRLSAVGALAPLAILCVPLLDLVLVSLARLQQGKSPMMGSPDHLAIRLKHRGWSAAQVMYAAMGLSAVGGAVALSLVVLPEPWPLRIFAMAAVLFVALLGWLWQLPVPGARHAGPPVPAANSP